MVLFNSTWYIANYSNPHHCQYLFYNYKKADFAYFSALISNLSCMCPMALVNYTDDIESS